MNLSKIDTVVINLEHRKDKREAMIQQMRQRKWPIRFFTAKLHTNPKRGCLESHWSVIERALQQHKSNLLVLEDDAMIVKRTNYTAKLPEDWCMAYLGGTVARRFEEYEEGKPWIRMGCWTTHAYLINLERKDFVEAISKMKDYNKEIDQFYLDEIHPKFPCYMVNPMMIVQQSGYSDIEKSNVNYDFMMHTLKGLLKPAMEVVDDSYVLKLPTMSGDELPYVSIITPTFERRAFFPMALHNFRNFDYPRNKLEWIIVDDSEVDDKTVEDLLPKDKRIRYLRIEGNKKKLTVAQKRNIGVEHASHPYIVHMDDDDYYPPESILARVKTLMKYANRGVQCVGCSEYGIYNVLENASSIASDGPLSLSEASMAYTKTFWEAQKFNEKDKTAEYRHFIGNRFQQCMDLPYEFVLIAMSHNKNLTGMLRYTSKQLKEGEEKARFNYYETLDEETQDILTHLKKYLLTPEPDFEELTKQLEEETA
jgi:Glycosyl transferase family 2